MIGGQFIKWAVAVCTAAALVVSAAEADRRIAGVPLPDDTAPLTRDTNPWGGIWAGAWGDSMKHLMTVEQIGDDGVVSVVYAIAGVGSIPPQWHRIPGTVRDGLLSVSGQGFSVTYRKLENGMLHARFAGGPFRSTAIMRQYPARTVFEKTGTIVWTVGRSEMLDTELTENGRAARLQAIIYRPTGDGPFPLAVLNHGSTGSGRDPGIAKSPWSDLTLARFLTDRGWLVAFPQRRGRGNSDGLYDEGFARNRAEGYACNPKRSLPGADRALTDIAAAIRALRNRDDVADGPVLMGGVSRGGILSAAYAGMYPDEISGVINFVGGWMGSLCRNASHINQTLFRRAASYAKPTIWLYGRQDPFYPISHSKENFDAFSAAGGEGTFHVFSTPSGNGHFVNMYEGLWRDLLDDYLTKLKPAQ